MKDEDREYLRFLGWLMVIATIGVLFMIKGGK